MVELKKLYVEKKVSEKSKKEYACLMADYVVDGVVETQTITFDTNIMLVLTDLSPSAFDRKLATAGAVVNIPFVKEK